ncbi:hypothetical protein E2C01_023054 [Portunus trituberculatus]|uniref:Uncharacterized protein n=1 Tax=Portunus trituberculatus TaxID=210409 RepID=A0A5B7E8Y0_PORTR|nr:hypothetical protein [Portunus trituberculatus]
MTFPKDTSVATTDRIFCYFHWIKSDRSVVRQGGSIALCHREGLQLQLLPVKAPAHPIER